ncbi:hypothetical protein N431DRAFT_501240 [Stipitochalara longipes BDJ]|nr:hypothetical protein N431DRAFT_501240 [Stipitochalara longipes BDJ]
MPPQQCSYCSREFNRAEHLQRHVRSHTKEKPFRCGSCGKGYAREDTLIRHAKSHCVGRTRRMTLSEASTGPRGVGVSRHEEPISLDNSSNRISQSPGGALQAQLQTIEISGSTSGQVTLGFGTGANLWDFQNLDFMDETPLWAIDNSFSVNGVEDGNLGQLQDIQLQAFDYSGGNTTVNGYDLSEKPPPPVLDMRSIWFTKVQRSDENPYHPFFLTETTPTSQPTSSPREPEIVDEECRRNLTRSLVHPFPQEDLLPSPGFLNLCVRRYFTCFNPVFPIIHAGTFQRTSENGLLLISMASVGCLFLGSQAAVQRGRRIFETLNKVILTSWDKVIGQSSGEIVAMVQAALIGQTFAMLSGDAKHLAIFEAYHGSMISWARRERMFTARQGIDPPEGLIGDELNTAWKEWARKEELRRIVLALQIHDSELTALLHREPFLKTVKAINSSPPTYRSFEATTALSWASSARKGYESDTITVNTTCQPHQRDLFTAYIKLQVIGGKIGEDRLQDNLDHDTVRAHQETLLHWHEYYAESIEEEDPDHLCMTSLWHWTYMNLLVDLDQLECAIGRDGPDAAQEAIPYVSNWVSTPESSRCMLHAFLLQKKVQSLRFDQTPALHIPRILFSAVIAWYCYIKYGPGNDVLDPSVTTFDTNFPEFKAAGPKALKQLASVISLGWNQGALSCIKAATVCELGGLLQRINEWGSAGTFAKVVAHLIDNEA